MPVRPTPVCGMLSRVESTSPQDRELALLEDIHDQVLREAGWSNVAEELRRLPADNRAEALASVGPEEGVRLASALTVRLHLANLADERNRVRILRNSHDPGADMWPALRASEALAQLDHLRIHPVLTAHPTEARRRAVATALRRIGEQLQRHDNPRLGPDERGVARRRLLEEVDLLHRTSVLRITQPEPLDEVRTVMTVFDQTLIRAVPRLYRTTEVALVGEDSGRIPTPVPAFIRFGSWVGGDRDGNPFVTADVTRRTLALQAEHALQALAVSVQRVGRTLTVDRGETPPSRALVEALERDAVAMPDAFREIRIGSPGEPHRQKMLLIAERLEATRQGRSEHSYAGPEELIEELQLVQSSLAAAGAHRAAHGELQHVIWYAQTFGFHLAELEVRQHSDVHRAALLDLVSQLDVPDPAAAVDDPVLLDALARDGWPTHVDPRQDMTREVLDTLRVIAYLQRRWGTGACGRYIVSFSHSAANLVAVRALARLAVGQAPVRLDVIPLFETGADLHSATEVLDAWIDLPTTRSWLSATGREVEVMLGYSDSAKDVGPAAATLVLADAQTQLVAWAKRNNVALTLFHGRGGSLGRGGGPLHRAITAQPADSVAGRLKVTEQGEVIFARYADTNIAQKHLERLTTAVLMAGTEEVATRNTRAAETYRDLSEVIENTSREAYLELVSTPGSPMSSPMPAPWTRSVTCVWDHVRSVAARRPRAGRCRTCGRSPGCSPGRRRGRTSPAGTGSVPAWQPWMTPNCCKRPTRTGRYSQP